MPNEFISVRNKNEITPIYLGPHSGGDGKADDILAQIPTTRSLHDDSSLSPKTKAKLLKCAGIITSMGLFALVIFSLSLADKKRHNEE